MNSNLFSETKALLMKNLDGSYPDARVVRVCIEFFQIGEVDTQNEKFHARIKITSKWYDNTITDEYDEKNPLHWNPKLFIENAYSDKFYEEISYSIKKESDNKTLIKETRISTGFYWEKMELNSFPLDIQELSINLTTKHKPKDCQLIADESKQSIVTIDCLNSFRDQQKFKLYQRVTVSNTSSYDTRKNIPANKAKRSKFAATCYCSRKPMFYITNCYSFNFLITVLSLTQFVIEAKFAESRIRGIFTLILTSFSFKVVTSRSLPTISYLTSLDKYQTFNIIFLSLLCIWHSICAALKTDYQLKVKIDNIMAYAFGSLFILIQIWLFVNIMISHQKVKKLNEKDKLFISKLEPSSLYDEYDNDD